MNGRKSVVAAIAASICSSCFAQASDERCVVKYPHADNGQTVAAQMIVANDGEPCEMHVDFGRGPPNSLEIHAKPGNGMLVGARSKVYYTPNPGFTGQDFFDVQWFGQGFAATSPNHTVRTKVEVTVRANSEEPPRGQ